MKKSLVALAVLSSVAGVAQAASSVTMYGRFEILYGDKSSELDGGKSLSQQSSGGLRIGFKGEEDLGNGMAATFQLEGRFDGDTGAKSAKRSFFDRESTVGLKGAFGHVRFGRSYSAMENGLPFTGNSRGASSFDSYAGEYTKGRHSNAMFYQYSASGFTVGGDITTKGGLDDGQGTIPAANDGTSGLKSAYGVYAKYKNSAWNVGAAYQQDNNPSGTKNEWGVGVAYTFKPVTVGVNYARAKGFTSGKATTYHAFISADVTANDSILLAYRRLKNSADFSADATNERVTKYGLGYVHSMSKRTSVFADIAREETKKFASDTKVKGTSWDIGLRHNF